MTVLTKSFLLFPSTAQVVGVGPVVTSFSTRLCTEIDTDKLLAKSELKAKTDRKEKGE
jgi:hypothetical protein